MKIDLVWIGNKCIKCNSIGTLNPYKGNILNDKEPDRLICSKCGEEYAIDLSNPNRSLAPLISNSPLNKFISEFKERNSGSN